MSIEECKYYLQNQHLNCAETVLKMISQKHGLDLTDDELKAVAAFGGGVCGDMCGALCGALASLGLLYVHGSAAQTDSFKDTCKEFVLFFKEKMGDITCKNLYEKYATEEEGCIGTVLRAIDTYDAFLEKEAEKRMKVVIIGGVAGGASAAARLRRNMESARIVLFEKDNFISFANCGLPYYLGNVIRDEEDLQIQTPESFHDRFNVDVRIQSEVLSIDSENKWVVVKDKRKNTIYREHFDKLILSPGAKPLDPFGATQRFRHVFTLRNIPDTLAIQDFISKRSPKTCAVIGAGYIGLEMVENLSMRGIQVSVIEAANHVLAPLDLDVAHEVHAYIRARGIKLYLGHKCTSIDENKVSLDDGTTVQADMVILSIGVTPETSFLQGSGIKLGDRGEIIVDPYLSTSVKDIFAIGDAVSILEASTKSKKIIPLAGPANKQGRIVADNVCGKRQTYEGSTGTAILKLFDLVIASTGANERSLDEKGIEYKKSFTYSASHASYYPDPSTMLIKLLFSPEDGRILGAQIVGHEGVDKRIDSFSNAIRFGLTVFDLQKMDLAYAPPFSSAKDPVNISGYVAGNILKGDMIPFYVEDIDSIPSNAICIDVRTPEEYANGTIPGFINIPVDDLRERLPELDRDKEIYITCQIGLRGYIAQRILMGHGFRTRNLSGGYRRYLASRTTQY